MLNIREHLDRTETDLVQYIHQPIRRGTIGSLSTNDAVEQWSDIRNKVFNPANTIHGMVLEASRFGVCCL